MKSRILSVVPAIAIAMALVGCASGSKPEAMVATTATPVHKSASAVTVSVAGGKDTSKMGASQISNDAFASAIKDSINKNQLFSKAVSEAGSPYTLAAFIGKVDQPTFGFSMTVTMEVNYTLTDVKSGKSVWTKDVSSTYTAKAGDAFAGTERLRLANEGAARENIRQMIEAVSALQLP
jgi:hypothetical protein